MRPQHVKWHMIASTDATILSNVASSERIFILLDLLSSSQCHSTFALRIRFNFIIIKFV